MYTLITGGAGYIGSHVTKIMNKLNEPLIVVDNLTSGNRFNCKYGVFINADITNLRELEETIFRKYKIHTVIHVAGKAFVKESFQKINDYYNINVIGTLNILNMMVKYNIPNIIFSSSCAVYGDTKELPITETRPLNPISPYGTTKKICEEIIINYSKMNHNTGINFGGIKFYGIKYVILRYFNVAGNDLDCAVVDNENNFKRIIPTIILKCLKNEIVQINGNTYNTKDGTCIRNYIHVNDLANAHIKAFRYLQKNECESENLERNKENLICNIGTDDNFSILEIISIIEKHTGRNIKYEFLNKIEGDPAIVYCDNGLAKNKLDWIITYNINDIIKSYIHFINEFLKGNFTCNAMTQALALTEVPSFDYSLSYNDKNYLGDTFLS